MRLVVDANILVGEVFRSRGRRLLATPTLQIAIAEVAWGEARHKLAKRADAMEHHGRVPPGEGHAALADALAFITPRVSVAARSTYEQAEVVARRRIPRDPDDWPTVALALTTDAAIWTNDADFLGCGLATWTTDTLLAELAADQP